MKHHKVLTMLFLLVSFGFAMHAMADSLRVALVQTTIGDDLEKNLQNHLPCLVQNSQVIIDTSGGHGGDDGRPDLRWIRYRPWATRTNAFVLVCNPVHDDTDFMGHSPWGGGSGIIRPDGSLQASLHYEKDRMIVEDIDLSLVSRAEVEEFLLDDLQRLEAYTGAQRNDRRSQIEDSYNTLRTFVQLRREFLTPYMPVPVSNWSLY